MDCEHPLPSQHWRKRCTMVQLIPSRAPTLIFVDLGAGKWPKEGRRRRRRHIYKYTQVYKRYRPNRSTLFCNVCVCMRSRFSKRPSSSSFPPSSRCDEWGCSAVFVSCGAGYNPCFVSSSTSGNACVFPHIDSLYPPSLTEMISARSV